LTDHRLIDRTNRQRRKQNGGIDAIAVERVGIVQKDAEMLRAETVQNAAQVRQTNLVQRQIFG
jgi:hypothetical protein